MNEKSYYVYMMSNKWNTVIYTGVTSALESRVWQHKNKTDAASFTSRYNCNKLVWYAETNDVHTALEEEKRIKAGSRANKIRLIENANPEWRDLSENWFEE